MGQSLPPSASTIAGHYDALDAFYRDVWGEHLHHGLWLDGRESVQQAVRQLGRKVISAAGIQPGMRVGDIGCGYGAMSRELAAEWGVSVDGYTLSPCQHAYAVASLSPDLRGKVRFHLQDWMEGDPAPGSFDALIAIECLSHIGDAEGFLAKAYESLRNGGRLGVAAWLRGDSSPRWIRDRLLKSICVEGRLAALRSEADYCRLAREAGFEIEQREDLTRRVAPTWPVIIRRLLERLIRRAEYRRALFAGPSINREFARTLFRIWLAYRLGAMGYGLLGLKKPV